MKILRLLLALVAASLFWVMPAQAAPGGDASVSRPIEKSRCEVLVGGRFLDLPGAATWVTTATYLPATTARRAACEIKGYVNPTVNFGLYLPAEGWNGKYLVRGCGGSCGQVFLDGACGKHLRDGYACLHTDMGHSSSQIDNNWVANNLQGVVDFGYRATHVTAVAGKAVAAAYYGKDPRRSYFFACSTGGRQAMVEAQRYPTDFDGIVAIAPATVSPFGARNWRELDARMNIGPDGKAILSDLMAPLLYKAAIRLCDMNDGVRDGLIDPRDCKFDPASIQCKPGQAAGKICLSPEAVDVARKLYARGAKPGSELNWIGTWTADPGPPVEFAQSRGDPATVESLYYAGNPDLRGLRDHGAKLLFAHGTTDTVVPPGPSEDYYRLATQTMGGRAETDKFFRFYEIPGMDHCSGGAGAWAVDWVKALDAWVDQGKAPDRLVGVKPKPGVELDYFAIDVGRLMSDQIAFSRPYFSYPQRAYYSGKGDPDSAASFVPGLKPNGRRAPVAKTMAAQSATALAALIRSTVAETEKQYLTSGLPLKNVSDRIGKQLRITIYPLDPPAAMVRAALAQVAATPLSDVARPAVDGLIREYD